MSPQENPAGSCYMDTYFCAAHTHHFLQIVSNGVIVFQTGG